MGAFYSNRNKQRAMPSHFFCSLSRIACSALRLAIKASAGSFSTLTNARGVICASVVFPH